MVVNARNGIAEMRVMAAGDSEHRHLVLLLQGLVISVIEYALAIPTLSHEETGNDTKRGHTH